MNRNNDTPQAPTLAAEAGPVGASPSSAENEGDGLVDHDPTLKWIISDLVEGGQKTPPPLPQPTIQFKPNERTPPPLPPEGKWKSALSEPAANIPTPPPIVKTPPLRAKTPPPLAKGPAEEQTPPPTITAEPRAQVPGPNLAGEGLSWGRDLRRSGVQRVRQWQRPYRVLADGRTHGQHVYHRHGKTDARPVRPEQRLHHPQHRAARAASAAPLFEPWRACLH